MSRAQEDVNRRMLRARDAMDRHYAEPLDIRALAHIAVVSEAHFIRTFRSVFGETPNRYLQRRRVERAMSLLRDTDRSITETVRVPGDAGREIFLELPGPPGMDAATGDTVRDLVTKGATGFCFGLTTDDCQGTYETLKAKGVEFTDEPSSRTASTAAPGIRSATTSASCSSPRRPDRRALANW